MIAATCTPLPNYLELVVTQCHTELLDLRETEEVDKKVFARARRETQRISMSAHACIVV